MYSWEYSSENGSSSGENECPQFILMSSLVLIILCTRGYIKTKHAHWHFHHQCEDGRSVKRVKAEVERLREKKTLIIDHILNYYILIKNNRVESFSCIASLFVLLFAYDKVKKKVRDPHKLPQLNHNIWSAYAHLRYCRNMWAWHVGRSAERVAMVLRAHGCKLTL